MKKYKITLLIISLIIILSACYVVPFTFIKSFYAPSGHFVMDEKLDSAHGDPNPNYEIGFRGGKLYYCFRATNESVQRSGIYEISENGAKFITNDYDSVYDYFNGIEPEPMDVYEEDADVPDDYDIIKKYDDVYFRKDEEYEYYESLYTVYDNTVIYLSKDFYIKEVDRKTHKCLFKKKLKDNLINLNSLSDYELRKYGDTILLISDKSINFELVSTDEYIIYNINDNYTKIFSKQGDGFEYFCDRYYKGTLFIGSDKGGVYRIDLKANKSQQLSGATAYDIFIFGDKWLYHTDRDGNLFRTAQGGGKTETLFNKGW